MLAVKLTIGQMLSKYVISVITDTGDYLPNNKIQPMKNIRNTSIDVANHFNLVRDCEKPVPHA